jgi:hypothetical protein
MDESPDTRRSRLERSRRRNRRLVAGGVAIVALVAAAGVSLGLDDGGDSATAEPGRGLDASLDAPLELPELEAIAGKPAREISHDEPLRLWVGGDSLAGAMGPALGEAASKTGVVETTIDYKVSSGLAHSGVRNWLEVGADDMEQYDPEAVVFFIGANDAPVANTHDGDGDGTPDWEPAYRSRVADMMDVLTSDASHRTVLWIGSPTLGDDRMDRGAALVNQVMRDEASERSPDVVYVDAYRLFSDEDGEYSPYVTTSDGESVRVRVGDGVHLTPAGAQYLAHAVFTLLDARWAILEHADGDNEIRWDYADSSGSGNGYSSSSGRPTYSGGDDWSDDDDGATDPVATTTTAAPVTTTTAPPVASTTAPPTTVAPTTTTAPPASTTTAPVEAGSG